jgi:hypothetical protein
MTKFEQLVEYVINDDEAKAKALFHDIVVEKSREIYEDLMQADEEEEGVEEGMEPQADAADDLMSEVEMDETGMSEEEDEFAGDEADDEIDAEAGDDEMGDMDDMGGEEGGAEPATKDDVLNLEDKLDQLMAEFEQLLGADNGDMGDDMDADMGDEELAPGAGGDAYAVDDTAEFGSDELAEAVNLKAAPKPVTSEEGNTYKKSPVAANAGAKGALAKPVSSGANEGGRHDSSAYSNSSKELIGKVGNSPAGATQRLTPATKPHLAQATGVNTKSPVKS